MHYIIFQIACSLVSNPSYAVCPWFLLFFFFRFLVMAPKVGQKFKTRANRNPRSTSSGSTLGIKIGFC